MAMFNPAQLAILREMLELGDLGHHPDDWSERMASLVRQAGAGPVMDRLASYTSVIQRLMELTGNGRPNPLIR